ncbi:MAG: hypothetical protein ABF453_02975 [Bifidobacterium psychraerophilum]|uniref:hypothetical protein n=1 Tax=Bifidobacterium psychraerophilum TaxID=218140 RepID=UPI0039EA6068
MSIANYSTSIDPVKTAGEIMGMLSAHGASNVNVIYEHGVPSGLSFTVPTGFGERGFELPVRVAGVLLAMQGDRAIPRSKCTQVQASRVAWRVARDWLRAQLALIDAGLAGLDEVMMPYMLADGDRTAWELYAGSQGQIEGGTQ